MHPQCFHINGQDLPVIRTTRKSTIALKLKPNGMVILVPKRLSANRLMSQLKSSLAWLIETHAHLEKSASQKPVRPLFKGQSGDTFEFKGQIYQIVWAEGEAAQSKAALKPAQAPLQLDEKRHLCLLNIEQCLNSLKRTQQKPKGLKDANPSDERIACQQIQDFFVASANDYLAPKLAFYAGLIGVNPKSMTVKGYKSRWGSCYPDGRIQFNWRLMQAPTWVIDYVIVHELCHLVHANHSADFWALVQKHYPKTAEAKAYIRQSGSDWIQFLV
ncbi:MAG: M48 family metallopeptidase [Gammaproteobacteria bacterium]|nr:M48 family metallopeptidase [Gammaproteobacteria bacterium]